jgi:hypothetical protein
VRRRGSDTPSADASGAVHTHTDTHPPTHTHTQRRPRRMA